MLNETLTADIWSVHLPHHASYILFRCPCAESQGDAILLFTYMLIANETHYDPGYDVTCDICKENSLCMRWNYNESVGVNSSCSICTPCSEKIISRASNMRNTAITMLSAIPFLANPEVNKDILEYIRGYVVALIKNDAQVFSKHCSHMQLLSYAHTYSVLLGSSGLTYSS